MDIKKIFDTFSKRNKTIEPYSYRIPETLRNKVIIVCTDIFSGKYSQFSIGDYRSEFWDEIHHTLLIRHGRLYLGENNRNSSQAETVVEFLLNAKDDYFLDFIEDIFKVNCLFHVVSDENIITNQLRELFTSENVGYDLTDIVKQTEYKEYGFPLHGKGDVISVLCYPRIIRKDDEIVHNEVLKPVLNLLSDSRYKSANLEFMDALGDYKKGDYGDCLTKSCSAFESVMKIICDNKGWKYERNYTAGTLVKIMIDKLKIDSCFESLLMIVATLRNKWSKSHGAGVETKIVSSNLARYCLNSTASAIIFLVGETK
jgi:hypothetical protein